MIDEEAFVVVCIAAYVLQLATVGTLQKNDVTVRVLLRGM